MAFNFLVPECLIRHSYSEKGKGIKLSQKDDERVAFFHLDNDAFRTRFRLHASKVCDVLIFYRKGSAGPILMLVELKGSDFDAAADQICSTHDALKPELQPALKTANWIALVVASGSCPPSRSKLQKRLNGRGISLLFATGIKGGNVVDARKFLE
jgi:hypothetical protein